MFIVTRRWIYTMPVLEMHTLIMPIWPLISKTTSVYVYFLVDAIVSGLGGFVFVSVQLWFTCASLKEQCVLVT